MKDSSHLDFEKYLEIQDKSVLVVGAGKMGNNFAECLAFLGIKDVTIIGLSQENVFRICKKFGHTPLYGGYEKHFPKIETKELVVICTPIMDLLSTAQMAIAFNQTNILIEKPGSINHQELSSFNEKLTNQNVRLGYNRLQYPSLKKLHELIIEEDGVIFCHFSFSEMLDRINFSDNPSIVYNRWGICNSLHVISMAFNLIGLPKKMSTTRSGKLKWHESGSVFVGSGITEKNIPFSYNADWGKDGRWFIEISTKKRQYRLMPIEELYFKNSTSNQWGKVSIPTKFKNTKPGICEEILAMLNQCTDEPTTITQGIRFIQIANEIFGY